MMYCKEGVSDPKHSFCTTEKYLRSEIEAETLKSLKAFIGLLHKLKVEMGKKDEKLNKMQDRLKKLKAETESKIEELKKVKAGLYKRYTAGELPKKRYSLDKSQVSRHITNLENTIKKAEEKYETIKVKIKEIPLVVQSLINQADGCRSIKALTQENVKTYIDKIYVYSGGWIEIRFRYQKEIIETVKLFEVYTGLFENNSSIKIHIGMRGT